MEDDELEYTLFNKREVSVFQIPPATSTSGHKAEEWQKCIWRGRCLIAGKGKDLSIKLLDAGSGQLFACCAIPNGDHEKYVERVTDSSRYFVLKITNGARHAFIGMGFEDRNDAFDFNCSLADFKSTFVDKDDSNVTPISQEPAKDLSLKDGQKIKIKLKVGDGDEERPRRKAPSASQGAGGGYGGFGIAPPPPAGGGLAPPPAGGGLAPPPAAGGTSRRQAAAPSVVSAAPAPAADDFFGDFADFQSAPVAAAAAPAAAPAPVPAPQAATSVRQDPVANLGAQFGALDFGTFASPAAAPAASSAPSGGAQPQLGGLDFGAFATPAATPAAPLAPSGGGQSQLGGLDFGAFATPAAPSAPSSGAQPQTSLSAGAAPVAPTWGAPAAAVAPSGAMQPRPSQQPSQPPPAQQSGGTGAFDPFAGFGGLSAGTSTGAAPIVGAPAWQGAPAQNTFIQSGSAKKNDPFADFDPFAM